jgi:hypothetical protein
MNFAYCSVSINVNISTYDTKIGNRWFENVAQFRYLGTTITNEI